MLSPLDLADLFEDYECAEIIRIAEVKQFKDAALVRGEQRDDVRRARIAWLDENAEGDWIFDRLVGFVISANRSHFDFELSEFAEKMQIAWYGAEQSSHFDWHVDVGDGSFAKRRKLTLTVQLSAGGAYEGGDLELNCGGRPQQLSRRMGAAMLFPSFALHRVTPVRAGARYSLTTWVHGPAFR